jgi:hypothetical protein
MLDTLAEALEALGEDPPDLFAAERWSPIRADEIGPSMAVRDPSWTALAIGQSTRVAVVESMLTAPHGSPDAELGMVVFSYVDAHDPSYRNWASYLPDTILQRWQ